LRLINHRGIAPPGSTYKIKIKKKKKKREKKKKKQDESEKMKERERERERECETLFTTVTRQVERETGTIVKI
jgi:hypothetical protein